MGLFGGKAESKPNPSSPASFGEKKPETVSRTASGVPTVIGGDAVVKGELASESDMRIEGRVEGKIRGAKEVIIGESGDVEAEVHAQVITVRGKVNGDCVASRKVEITATGRVFGNITARAIVVAEGATFRGASKMMTDTPRKAAGTAGTGPPAKQPTGESSSPAPKPSAPPSPS